MSYAQKFLINLVLVDFPLMYLLMPLTTHYFGWENPFNAWLGGALLIFAYGAYIGIMRGFFKALTGRDMSFTKR